MAEETTGGNVEGSIKALEVKFVELEKGGGIDPSDVADLKEKIQAIRDAIANAPKPEPHPTPTPTA
jgi:hypothetical protein